MTAPTVLIIEDDPSLRALERRLAGRIGFTVLEAADGPEAVAIAAAEQPDLVISDYHMPGMDGPEVVQAIRAIPSMKTRPILMVTADQSPDSVARLQQAGVDRVITKPFDPRDFRTSLEETARAHGLSLEPTRRTAPRRGAAGPGAELAALRARASQQAQLLVVLAAAMERPGRADAEATRNHVQRVGALAALVASKLGLSGETVEQLRSYAGLHDVGKIGLREHILRKPDLYTPAEREEMRTHTLIGAELLRSAGLPGVAVNVAMFHHERWDGRGYPQGLRGARIPVEARVVAVVDVYDALRSSRSYRPEIPREEVQERFSDLAGTQLDPELVKVFLQHPDEVEEIYRAHADPSGEPDLEVWR